MTTIGTTSKPLIRICQPGLRYWVVDGFYSKKKFVDGVVALKLHLIGKLRRDADLRYLYNGQQKARGAKRQYDGKVELSDLSRWAFVNSLEPQIDLYSAVAWYVSLKRQIRVAWSIPVSQTIIGQVLFFSSDIELDAEQMVQAYKARFQIEFIFRDAKQFTGAI